MAKKNDPIADALKQANAAPPVPPPVLPPVRKPEYVEGPDSAPPTAPVPGMPAAPSSAAVQVAREEAKAIGSTGDIAEETKAALDRQAKEDAPVAGEPDPRDARIQTLERQVQDLGKIVGGLVQFHHSTRAAVGFLNLMGEFVQSKAGGVGTGTYPGKIDDIPSIDDLPKMMAD